MVLAQFSFFDRWGWPISEMILLAILVALAVASIFSLRNSAESTRAKVLEEIRERRTDTRAGYDSDRVHLMEDAEKHITSEKRGAFAPLSQNPVLGAVLLPLTGAGTRLVLNRLLQST